MLSMMKDWGLYFAGNWLGVYMDWFHNFNCSLLLGVLVFVMMMFVYLIWNSHYFKYKKMDYRLGELFCCLIPMMILVFQMMPSLNLLYMTSGVDLNSLLTVKVVGHQWYWSYEYCDIEGLEFDSYMKSVDDLSLGEFRLLDVDNRCVLPVGTDVNFCISSMDVIHSWAVPSMSIKVDALSGFISSIQCKFPLIGVFYGQCSEICGANHSFMPVVLEVTSVEAFKYWVLSKLG